MKVFKGTTSGSVLQVAFNIPCELVSYSLSNTSGGSVTATVYVRDEGVDTIINTQSINAGATYINDVKAVIGANVSIYLVVNGAVDYYFSLT